MRLREMLESALLIELDEDGADEASCANVALAVFREWLGSEEARAAVMAKLPDDLVNPEYAANTLSAALASLTEAQTND